MTNTNQDAINNAECHATDISLLMAALEADYDQLEELTDYAQALRDDLEEVSTDLDALLQDNEADDYTHLQERNKELAQLLSATEAKLTELQEVTGEFTNRDDVERALDEYPLSLEVRSDWTPIDEELELAEYSILITTGGPAARIRGEMDCYGEPATARMEVCDWFTSWTEVRTGQEDALLEFAQYHIHC